MPRGIRFALKLTATRRLVYSLGLMLLFWAIYDGLISFFTPVFITNLGFSTTSLGLIIAFQSVTGAVFDFFISRYLKKSHYLKIFIIIFLLSFLYPLVLYSSRSLPLLLLAMAHWGLYYDLLAFAIFNFVSRHSRRHEHCQNISIIGIFKTVGYLLAPAIASWTLIASTTSFTNLLVAYLFLVISAIIFVVFYSLSGDTPAINSEKPPLCPKNFTAEFSLWLKIGRILLPVLLFNLLICLSDYFFWTLGPIFFGTSSSATHLNGLFMVAYSLPVLLVSWFAEKITHKVGKKRTAYASFFLSSLILLSLYIVKAPYLIIFLIFASSVFSSLAWPSIKGAYVDYLTETSNVEKEIEGLTDFSTNIGQIIGPILAGVLAQSFGLAHAFSLLALINIIAVLFLVVITPKAITVRV
ncbi:MAG: MFS transporter [Candidatus Shapirobacteria bacterium]|jgi:MFS family permease